MLLFFGKKDKKGKETENTEEKSMNIFKILRKEIEKAVILLKEQEKITEVPDMSRMTVEPPKDEAHGDVATNVAMVLSGKVGMKPRDFASLLADVLQCNPAVEKVEVAGPGFINLFLSDAFWHEQLSTILRQGTAYGFSDMGNGEKVNVEFVSVNPTGPMHVGHSRGAVFGDALAGLLQKAGFDVTREYYMNDAGAQMDKLARSAYLRYREAMGEEIGEIPSGYYPGDYLKPVGEFIAQKDGDKWMNATEDAYLDYFRKIAGEKMMDLIKADLDLMGIHFDVYTSERAIKESGGIEKALKILEDKDLIYQGVLEKPKSAKAPEDWEPQEMTIFKSTEFGDEADRPLRRSDGTYTYFMPDIAYQYNKFERGFKKMIMVLGADHSGYVTRLKSATKAVTGGEADLDIKLVQMVNFSENGAPIKMSKRAGTFVMFSDLLDEIGKDVTRFFMVTRKNDTQLEFDFAKVKEQSKDNPVFYVQYAHARAYSVFRHAEEMFGADVLDKVNGADLSLLTDETELALIRTLAGFPRQVELAAAVAEPHRIAYYLNEVASLFHALWNKGRDNVQMRFLSKENQELSMARLALIKGTTNVIASGLEMFGVIPAKEM